MVATYKYTGTCARATIFGAGTGKLNGDTKIANVGKKVYEGCFVKRDFICCRV